MTKNLSARFLESLYGEPGLPVSRYNDKLTDYANQNSLDAYTLSNKLDLNG